MSSTPSNSGSVGSCTATVTVEDGISPVSECQDITVYLDDLGEVCVTPQEIDGGSTDNCGITLQEIGMDNSFKSKNS